MTQGHVSEGESRGVPSSRKEGVALGLWSGGGGGRGNCGTLRGGVRFKRVVKHGSDVGLWTGRGRDFKSLSLSEEG